MPVSFFLENPCRRYPNAAVRHQTKDARPLRKQQARNATPKLPQTHARPCHPILHQTRHSTLAQVAAPSLATEEPHSARY
jgi:hypothetical protein